MTRNSAKFTVESEVPIPVPGRGALLYPWDRMKAGDSFFVEKREDKSATDTGKMVQMSGWSWLQRKGIENMSCTTRIATKDFGGERGVVKGVRIWFVEKKEEQNNA